jgi:hypothetical protein
MAESKCSRCRQLLTPDDTIAFDGNRVVHLDCERPRGLSREERALLFKYCFDHAVVACPPCAQDFRQNELAADLVGNRTHLCPRCRMDLTERVREHLYGCALLPGEVRWSANEARAAARRLVNDDQLHDQADVLMREAKAAIATLRETMRRTTWGR